MFFFISIILFVMVFVSLSWKYHMKGIILDHLILKNNTKLKSSRENTSFFYLSFQYFYIYTYYEERSLKCWSSCRVSIIFKCLNSFDNKHKHYKQFSECLTMSLEKAWFEFSLFNFLKSWCWCFCCFIKMCRFRKREKTKLMKIFIDFLLCYRNFLSSSF